MICENPARVIVTFTRDVADDFVTLDLPTQPLNPKQIVAAQRMLEWEHSARRVDRTDDGDFSYQLDLPPDPSRLANLTLDVFENVYGRRPAAALAITTHSLPAATATMSAYAALSKTRARTIFNLND
jgi:hypothetical protein